MHRRREGLTTRGEAVAAPREVVVTTRGEMVATPSPVCDELEVDAELRRNFEGREMMDEGAASVKT
jgi:hypothetical protein